MLDRFETRMFVVAVLKVPGRQLHSGIECDRSKDADRKRTHARDGISPRPCVEGFFIMVAYVRVKYAAD